MDLRQTIIEKEKELISPDVRDSVEKLKSMISEDFLEIGSSGKAFGLKDVLEWLPGNSTWLAKIGDFDFRVVTDNLVLVVYKAFIRHDEKGEGTYSLRSSIWRNESGVWRIVFHQGTRTESFDISRFLSAGL